MVIPSKSVRSIRICWKCVHYNADNNHECNLDFCREIYDTRCREFSKQMSMDKLFDRNIYTDVQLEVAAEFPCIHHFIDDELKELGESMP